jgi:hypothetical protein
LLLDLATTSRRLEDISAEKPGTRRRRKITAHNMSPRPLSDNR